MHVKIPKINQYIPIFAGTSEDLLQKGTGHLERTSMLIGGKNKRAVITAHRDLSESNMFRNLNLLQKNDVFYIKNIFGVLKYEVA